MMLETKGKSCVANVLLIDRTLHGSSDHHPAQPRQCREMVHLLPHNHDHFLRLHRQEIPPLSCNLQVEVLQFTFPASWFDQQGMVLEKTDDAALPHKGVSDGGGQLAPQHTVQRCLVLDVHAVWIHKVTQTQQELGHIQMPVKTGIVEWSVAKYLSGECHVGLVCYEDLHDGQLSMPGGYMDRRKVAAELCVWVDLDTRVEDHASHTGGPHTTTVVQQRHQLQLDVLPLDLPCLQDVILRFLDQLPGYVEMAVQHGDHGGKVRPVAPQGDWRCPQEEQEVHHLAIAYSGSSCYCRLAVDPLGVDGDQRLFLQKPLDAGCIVQVSGMVQGGLLWRRC